MSETTYDQESSDPPPQPRLTLVPGQMIDGVHKIVGSGPEPKSGGEAPKKLGQGGTSTVYLAMYKDMQQRAIKFLTLNYLSGETGQRTLDFQTTFNRERVFLSTLSHGCIARLHDFGSYKDEHGIEWQYIATDYIDGEELKPTLESPEITGADAYRLICQVLHAVQYMHSMRVLHADIKWQNIKCRKSPAGHEAVLLDLGTAHYVPLDEDAAGEVEALPLDTAARVRFITTYRILHPKHREHRGRVVNKDIVRDLFPSHDIHSVGVLLAEIIEEKVIRDKLTVIIGLEGLHALRAMIANILNSPISGYYSSVQQIHADWHKLKRTYLAPVGVPELSLAAEFKYSVQTSAGRGVITPRLSPLVNHKLFQRLRRVPQLEMTMMKFPGATHTRFAHSMAVLRNTRYYLAHLLNDTNFRLLAERSDLEATILLGLLHDVGHYQLSHMFEDYSSNQRGDNYVGPWSKIGYDIPSDDDLLWYVLDPNTPPFMRGDYGQKIETAWRESEKRLGLASVPSLADLIRDNFSVETYEAMLRIHHSIYRPQTYKDIKPVQLVLGAVLSSDIDADKVSYLVEDANRSGVNYGAGVDFDGLLGALRMPALADIRSRPTLGITQKGLAAAQSIAVSRNLMVGQVYWHHSNRSATSMVKYAIARMLDRGAFSMPDYIEDTLFMEYDVALHYLFDKFELARDLEEVNPIAGLLDGERRLYATAFSTARLDRAESEQLTEILTRKRFDEVIQLESDLCEIVRNASGISNIRKGEVLIDVPLKERERPAGERGGKVIVYNSSLDVEGTELQKYTPFLEQVKRQHVRENRVCRVFISPRVKAAGDFDAIATEVKQFILNRYGV